MTISKESVRSWLPIALMIAGGLVGYARMMTHMEDLTSNLSQRVEALEGDVKPTLQSVAVMQREFQHINRRLERLEEKADQLLNEFKSRP